MLDAKLVQLPTLAEGAPPKAGRHQWDRATIKSLLGYRRLKGD